MYCDINFTPFGLCHAFRFYATGASFPTLPACIVSPDKTEEFIAYGGLLIIYSTSQFW
jgi:hypothetical protein